VRCSTSLLRNANVPWANWRRGQDYHDDGQFIWFDADTLIRQTGLVPQSRSFFSIFLALPGV
jgi:hypothetical protein